MPAPADLVAPAIGPAMSCMRLPTGALLGCPGDTPYQPMGICTLMLKIALGSIAPFMPMLDVVLGLPGSILDIPNLPSLAPDLPGLPFIAIAGPDLPPVSIPGIGDIGNLGLPAWDGLALGSLFFSILTIPIDIAVGLLSFQIPDISFDGMLELVLGAIAIGLDLPAIMLPQLGLLDLAICIIPLILLPVLLVLAALGAVATLLSSPVDEGGAGIELPPIPSEEEAQESSGANLTPEEKKAKGEAIIARMVARENEKDRAKRQADMDASEKASSRVDVPPANYKKRELSYSDEYYG